MKKTNNINLNSQIFHIDEDACAQLQTYIKRLENHYLQEEDGQEIMADIESRIAELFRESLQQNHKEVISLPDIHKVIEIMGTPDVIINEDSEVSSKPVSRKLYRNPDSNLLGGVASGLAVYLSISPIWIRLIFVLVTFYYGSAIVIYIILWIVIPIAKTSRQKLEMKGETPTVSAIEKNIRDTYSNVKKDTNFHCFINKSGKMISRIFSILGKILRNILKVIGSGVAVIALLTGGILFISFFVFFIGGYHYLPATFHTFLQYASGSVPVWGIMLLSILLVCIPLLLITYYSAAYLFKFRGNKVFLLSSVGLWMLCCLTGFFVGIGSYAKYSQVHEQETQLTLAPQNQKQNLCIKLNNLSYPYYKPEEFLLDQYLYYYSDLTSKDSNNLYFRPCIAFISTEETLPRLVITQKARGINKIRAIQSTENIEYSYQWKNDTLSLNTYFTLRRPEWNVNEIFVTLFIPENYCLNIQNLIPRTLSGLSGIYDSEKYDTNIPLNRKYIMKAGKLTKK